MRWNVAALIQLLIFILFLSACEKAKVSSNFSVSITNVTPRRLLATEPTQVTIEGQGFAPGMTAEIGDRPCLNVKVISSIKATCIVSAGHELLASTQVFAPLISRLRPSNALLKYSLVVSIKSNELPDSSNFTFEVISAPELHSSNPTSSAPAGGGTVSFLGAGLSSATKIYFGKEECLDVRSENSSLLSCTVPKSNKLGTVQVTAVNPDGQKSPQSLEFVYDNLPPSIKSIFPDFLDLTGGTVQISGSDFKNPKVTLAGNALSCTTSTSTKITCIFPTKAAGNYPIVVTNDDGKTSNTINLPYIATSISNFTPKITESLNPDSNTFSLSINLYGYQTGDTFLIGSNPLTGCILNPALTAATCSAPRLTAGFYLITQRRAGVQIAQSNQNLEFKDEPIMNVANPQYLPATGSLLTISGRHLDKLSNFSINGISCPIQSQSFSQVLCMAGSSVTPGSFPIVAMHPTLGMINGPSVTYGDRPFISSISPATGPNTGGLAITIFGSNFISASVTVGGVNCPITGSSSGSSIVCTPPPTTNSGVFPLVVKNSDGVTSNGVNYTYYIPPPPRISLDNQGEQLYITNSTNGFRPFGTCFPANQSISIEVKNNQTSSVIESVTTSCSGVSGANGNWAINLTVPPVSAQTTYYTVTAVIISPENPLAIANISKSFIHIAPIHIYPLSIPTTSNPMPTLSWSTNSFSEKYKVGYYYDAQCTQRVTGQLNKQVSYNIDNPVGFYTPGSPLPLNKYALSQPALSSSYYLCAWQLINGVHIPAENNGVETVKILPAIACDTGTLDDDSVTCTINHPISIADQTWVQGLGNLVLTQNGSLNVFNPVNSTVGGSFSLKINGSIELQNSSSCSSRIGLSGNLGLVAKNDDDGTQTLVGMQAQNISVDCGVQVNASKYGYVSQFIATGNGGGGHGGVGGSSSLGTTGGSSYDSAQNPEMHGAAGGAGIDNSLTDNWCSAVGGNGGGVIKVVAIDTLTLSGNLVADGADGKVSPYGRPQGCWEQAASGGGAGGSITIKTSRLIVNTASALLSVNGGNAPVNNRYTPFTWGGGGAGGRISIQSDNSSSLLPIFQFEGGMSGNNLSTQSQTGTLCTSLTSNSNWICN